ncbi:MAG: hypothetical protein J5I47_05435, partial [Vicingus serpentipes]|nr:hypothetical protein [Vicingus serpentipes]
MKTKLLALLLTSLYLPLMSQICTGSSFQKTYTGGGEERAHSVQPTSDGGYVLVGETTSYGAGGQDIFVMKIDVNGNQQWTKTYGTTAKDDGSSLSIIQSMDGGYLIAGHTGSGTNGYVIKLGASGNIQWEKKEANTLYRGAKELSNGDFILTGNAYTFGSGTGVGGFLLVRLSSSGAMLWSKGYVGTIKDQVSNVWEYPIGYLIETEKTSTYA